LSCDPSGNRLNPVKQKLPDPNSGGSPSARKHAAQRPGVFVTEARSKILVADELRISYPEPRRIFHCVDFIWSHVRFASRERSKICPTGDFCALRREVAANL
jgi:hypothetical protein